MEVSPQIFPPPELSVQHCGIDPSQSAAMDLSFYA